MRRLTQGAAAVVTDSRRCMDGCGGAFGDCVLALVEQWAAGVGGG